MNSISYGTRQHNDYTIGNMKFVIYDHSIPLNTFIMNKHLHSEYEIIYVYDGEIRFDIQNFQYTLRCHEALFINPDDLHNCTAIHKKGRFVSLLFSENFPFPDLLDPIYEKYIFPLHNQHLVFPSYISGKTSWERLILQHIKDLFDQYFNDDPFYYLGCRIQLLSIFKILLDQNAFVKNHNKAIPKYEQIRDVLTLIEEDYKKNIRIDALADQLHICPEYFCRLFKAVMGKSPKEYIVLRRIDEAIRLLTLPLSKEEPLTISEIAVNSGFNNITYFARCFKKYIGQSPSAYRKKYYNSLDQ